jgi:internalin A
VNRGVTTLDEIQKFRNLTELDVSGNQLRLEVPELKRLTFLKKLSIANNQIEKMWALPTTLEFLNISQNLLHYFDPEILESLSSLKVLDVAKNQLINLEGVENLTRLKRLIAFDNKITDLKPIFDLTMIVELDLESNNI